jgi:hypothetical protein
VRRTSLPGAAIPWPPGGGRRRVSTPFRHDASTSLSTSISVSPLDSMTPGDKKGAGGIVEKP